MSLTLRSGLGQSEPRRSDLYRVLRDAQEPGHTSVPCTVSGPGRLACGAQHGDDGHREHHGQQRLGGQCGGIHQTRGGQHQVGQLSNALAGSLENKIVLKVKNHQDKMLFSQALLIEVMIIIDLLTNQIISCVLLAKFPSSVLAKFLSILHKCKTKIAIWLSAFIKLQRLQCNSIYVLHVS